MIRARDTAGLRLQRSFVFKHARLRLGGMWGMHDWPLWMRKATDDSAMLPQVPSPADIFVIVAGSSGKRSAVVPNCTFSRAVSRVIDRAG